MAINRLEQAGARPIEAPEVSAGSHQPRPGSSGQRTSDTSSFVRASEDPIPAPSIPAIRDARRIASCDADVTVVGAGPIGLASALLLVRYGVAPDRVRIVDAKPGPEDATKASALQPGVFDILEQAGVLDEVRAASVEITGTEFRNSKKLIAAYESEDTKTPPALGIGQGKIEEILREKLKSYGVEVEWGTVLDRLELRPDGSVSAALRSGGSTKNLTSGFILGCDGLHSTVRKQAGIEFQGTRMGDLFAVVDTTLPWAFEHEHGQAIMHRDMMLFAAPLPGEKRYRLFATLVNETEPPKDRSPESDIALLQKMHERAGVPITREQAAALHLNYFKVDEKQAATYQRGHVLLAGDAAHVHSPAGGQGLNTGLADAQNLAWKLARVIDGTAKEDFLSTYEEERRPVAARVLKETGESTWLFAVGGVFGWLRDLLVPAVLGVFKKKFATHVAQLDLSYAGSRTVENDGPKHGLSAGDRAPVDVEVSFGGQKKTLREVLKGAELSSDHVLLFDAPGRDRLLRKELSRALTVLRRHDHVSAHVIVDSEDEARRMMFALRRLKLDRCTDVLVDEDGGLRRAYGAKREGLFVIRPDGYLGYRSEHLKGDKLVQSYLRNDRYYPAAAG